jgi:hypothetical protein
MIIDRVERFLRRVGLISQFSEDDMINASTEDKLREHETLVQRAQGTLHARIAANEHLRDSIRIASERTDAFGEFERKILRREGKAS